jgi:excisionase family DNA binding protein
MLQPGFEFEHLLDSEEAAAMLKIHPKTLQKLARSGEIRGVQIGKLWRFRASSLNAWLAEKIVARPSVSPQLKEKNEAHEVSAGKS